MDMIGPQGHANDWDRRGLPAWTYHSEAMLKLEIEELFLNHWQLAGHVSDAPKPGSYFTFDLAGERALIVRDEEGRINAFHNLCRHRGSRVVPDASGQCRNALVCPFHGWVYNLDGTLRGPARPQSFGDLDRSKFGLKPIEMEVWMGFVFVRFQPGPQASVAETMARFAPELGAYNMPAMVPVNGFYAFENAVNWKSIRDVDNEGYHVALAHPALQDLYGSTYFDEPFENGASRSIGRYQSHAGRRWSVRNYIKLSGRSQTVPEQYANVWGYYGLFPNAVIAVTPETVQFYQEIPLGVDRSLIRGAVYRHPQESRELRLARYLAQRIDMQTYREDIQLSEWSNESMKSRAFEGFHLSDLERGVKSHHDHIRAMLPVATLCERPDESRLAALNAELRAAAAA